ncbi:MAG: FGGY-family carbohydrate kinase [Candidatus Sumerlaeaceae bacterium]
MPKAPTHVIGIDVGTGSARAGVFDLNGHMAGVGVKLIQIWKPEPDFAEQSSADIWRAVCAATKAALKQSHIESTAIAGVAYDATCSLVAIDHNGDPVTMSPTGADEQNIIMWMDHRAMAEAARLTKQGHDVIRYLGGVVSPEHQIPKLMWLKKNLPKSWGRATRFFDLPDWLAFRSTARDVRSLCTTVCKWTYLAHEKDAVRRWHREFFRKNGLLELLSENRIGAEVEPMGNCCGGLTVRAARELGLEPGTPVAVGIIDAHAGGLGVLGMTPEKKNKVKAAERGSKRPGFDDVLCLIGGTSTCHMVVSPKARFVPGVWGPYFSAMVPGLWLNEGGQSATGALMDYVITTHARYADALAEAKAARQSIYEYLNAQVDRLASEARVKHRAELTRSFHVLPYFHGNRSPNADPNARGAIHGLALHATLDDLALLYYATIQAIAYGTRDIIEALNAKGYTITRLHATGGGTKNPLWMQEHADATGCDILLPREPEAVLLGSAILAAVGAGIYPDIHEAMRAMSASGGAIRANSKTAAYHTRKMRIHRELYRDQLKYNEITHT